MKNMMILAQLCLTLCWMLSVDSMRIPRSPIPLDMADESVDDMYDGCNDEASMEKIKSQYSKELTSETFGTAWKNAEDCADQNFNIRSKEDMALTKDHMQAICVYTNNTNVYSAFNKAVREQRKLYTNSFQFHILHALLTTAIRILNPNDRCHITYRRTTVAFTGELNKKIRLGSFSSSSYRMNLTNFGNETCFMIKTCFGGYLKNYSVYEDEKEVLIPPFEMFTIKDIVRPPSIMKGLEDCEVVYVLQSERHESNLNCGKPILLKKIKNFVSSCFNCFKG